MWRALALVLVVGTTLVSSSLLGAPEEGLVAKLARAQQVATPALDATPVPAVPTPTATATEAAVRAPTDTVVASLSPTPTPSPTATATAPAATATPISTLTPVLSESIVDSNGGVIASPDGHVTLTFPAAATTERLRVRVSSKTESAYRLPDPNTHLLSVWQFDATAIDRGGLDVRQFDSDITLDLRYTADELFGMDESMIRYWTFDDVSQAWVESPATMVEPYRWQVSLNHFSTQASSSDGVLSFPPILEQAQVNLNQGTASFNYPIEVAPGLGSVQPQLNLGYDSGRVDETVGDIAPGWVGLGWDLSTPSITRAVASQTSDDRYYLNMNGVGGELLKTTSNKWTTRNQQFLDITHTYTCESCNWIVRDQSGNTYTFGDSANALRWYKTTVCGNDPGSCVEETRWYQWDLSSVQDVRSNVASYQYQQIMWSYGSYGGLISAYPSFVTYPGGKVSFNLRTTNLVPSGLGYDERRDAGACRASAGYETQALDNVLIESLGTDGALHQLRRYTFAYDEPSETLTTCQNYAFRLKSVSQGGVDDLGSISTTTFGQVAHEVTRQEWSGFCTSETRTEYWLEDIDNGFGGHVTFEYEAVPSICQYARQRVLYKRGNPGAEWLGNWDHERYTSYEYANGPDYDSDAVCGGASKTVFRGYGTVTEKDLENNKTIHTFIMSGELAGRESQVEVRGHEASPITWKLITNNWVSVASGGSPCSYHNQLQSVTLKFKDATVSSQARYQYDSGTGAVTRIETDGDSDPNNGNNGGANDCHVTINTYVAQQYGGAGQPRLVLPKKTTATACGSATALAESENFYDGKTSGTYTRGNLTATRQMTGTGNYVYVLTSYNDNGTVGKASVPVYDSSAVPANHDGSHSPNGLVWSDKGRTEIAYDGPSGGRFPSSKTAIVYHGSAQQASQTSTIYYDGQFNGVLGLPTKVIGPNGLMIGETQYDAFGRTAKQWQSPDNPQSDPTAPSVQYTYEWTGDAEPGFPDPGVNQTIVMRRMVEGSANTIDELHCMDGLGTEIQTSREFAGGIQRAQTAVDSRGLAVNSRLDTQSAFTCTPNQSNGPNKVNVYDALGNVVSTTVSDAGGGSQSTVTVAYSTENSQLVKTTVDQVGRKTDAVYDRLGRLVKTRTYTGRSTPWTLYSTTTYAYDALDNLLTVTDNAGNQTTLTYDALGRKKTLLDPDMSSGTAWQYEYDAAGNLIQQTDARGVVTSLAYDSLNRLRTKSYSVPGGSAVPPRGPTTLSYDGYNADGANDPLCTAAPAATAIGQLTSMSDDSGSSRWCYDVRGRQVKEQRTVSGGCASVPFVFTRSYDSGNRLTQLVYPDGESLDYGYDDSTRGGALTSIATGIYYTYIGGVDYQNALGSPSMITFSPDNVPLYTTYAFDALYRLQQIRSHRNWFPPGGTVIQDLSYQYYDSGEQSNIIDGVAGENLHYTYDDLGRLTTAQQQQGASPSPSDPVLSSYRYDDQPNSLGAMTAGGRIGSLTGKNEGGDLTFAHANYSHVHAVSAAGNDVFTYDANGNMASRLYQETYKFDVENRLVQAASYPSQTDYTYNGSGDLVRRTSSSGAYPGAIDEQNVYVDGIYEQQCFGTGDPIITKRYEAFGRVFAERRSTPVPGPSTLTYLLSDHLNSTVGTTNTDSEAVDRVQYYPFGAVRSGGVATDRTYTGQQTEAGSALKLSYYHARFYSAALGHFVSADPTSGDGLNRYAYAKNNPMRYNDPTGLDAESDLRALAAAFGPWSKWGGTFEGYLKTLKSELILQAIRDGLIEITDRPLFRHPELAQDALRYGYKSIEYMYADVMANGKLIFDTKTGHLQYVKLMPDNTLTRVTFDPKPAGQGIKVFSAETGMDEARVRRLGASRRWVEVKGKYNPREGGPLPPIKDEDPPSQGGPGSGGNQGKPWYEEIFEGIRTIYTRLPGTGDGTCAEASACE